MRFGRHREAVSSPPMLPEFTEAVADLEAQIQSLVDRLEATARSAGQVVQRARRSRDAAVRTKGNDGDGAK
jgi:hypothetical protein